MNDMNVLDIVTGHSMMHEPDEWRQHNAKWLIKAFQISCVVLTEMRNKNLNVNDVANLMETDIETVKKIIRGTENLLLSEIVHIENSLNIKLIER